MSGLTAVQLAEGAVRQPYFYVGPGGAVLCTKCAPQTPDFGDHQAVYTADRLLMCGGCHVYLGPTEAEQGG